MGKIFKSFFFAAILIVTCSSCDSGKGEPPEAEKKGVEDGIRIAWDFTTLRKIAPLPGRSPGYYGYARMIQLNDERLACVYESSAGNIELTISMDMGENWISPAVIFQTTNNITMAVPSIIELSDHSLLIACNPRPREPYTSDRKFGIKVRKSIDGGNSWLPEQLIYEAQSTFEDGCWEPAFVQLPSGEVQVYFSNEGIYTASGEQNISMFRSFDMGETWTNEPEIVGFRQKRRDGMPVPLLLSDKGELLISIEDNKAGEFKPSVYHEKLIDNWSDGTIDADDPRRYYHPLKDPLPLDVYAGGPYLARLHTGEVLLSYQTTWNRNKKWDYSSMAVEIGDDAGTLFSRRSIPFFIPLSKWGLWNSLCVMGENTPVAITSTNAFSASSTEVWMISGHIIPEFEIPTGTANVDGILDEDCWNGGWPYFIGSRSETNLQATLLADQQSLYMAALVHDPDLIVRNEQDTCDGIIFQVDAERKGYIAPQTGVYAFHLSPDGSIRVMKGEAGEWVSVDDVSQVHLKTSLIEKGYRFEMEIPWSFLKSSIPNVEKMGVNFVLKNDNGNGDFYTEDISSNESMQPFTWCPVFLPVF